MKQLQTVLDGILGDPLSGSISLLKKLIDNLSHWASNSDELQQIAPADFSQIISKFQSHLIDFTVLNHFLNEILGRVRAGNDLMELHKWCQHYEYEWSDIADRMAKNFLDTVELSKGTVLLHSNSGTIHSIFRQLREQEVDIDIDIIQTESRPNLEGVVQAEILAEQGYQVKLVADAASHQIMNDVDLVLLGADSIFQDYFVNKLGSYPIVAAARQNQVPVFIIADSRKLWTSIPGTELRRWSGPKNQDPKELYKGANQQIQIQNHYFESVPNAYIKAFVTENQVYRPGEFWEL